MSEEQAWIKHEMESLHRRLTLLVAEHRALRAHIAQLKKENEALKAQQQKTLSQEQEAQSAAQHALQLKAWHPQATPTRGTQTQEQIASNHHQRKILDQHIERLNKCIQYLERTTSLAEDDSSASSSAPPS